MTKHRNYSLAVRRAMAVAPSAAAVTAPCTVADADVSGTTELVGVEAMEVLRVEVIRMLTLTFNHSLLIIVLTISYPHLCRLKEIIFVRRCGRPKRLAC